MSTVVLDTAKFIWSQQRPADSESQSCLNFSRCVAFLLPLPVPFIQALLGPDLGSYRPSPSPFQTLFRKIKSCYVRVVLKLVHATVRTYL